MIAARVVPSPARERIRRDHVEDLAERYAARTRRWCRADGVATETAVHRVRLRDAVSREIVHRQNPAAGSAGGNDRTRDRTAIERIGAAACDQRERSRQLRLHDARARHRNRAVTQKARRHPRIFLAARATIRQQVAWGDDIAVARPTDRRCDQARARQRTVLAPRLLESGNRSRYADREPALSRSHDVHVAMSVAKHRGVARIGAVSRKSIRSRPSCMRSSMKPPPPMFPQQGSTTASA